MKKIILVGLIALLVLATGGCATIVYPDGTKQRIPLPQVSAIVTLKNNCAPLLDVEGSDGVLMKGVKYSTSVTVPVISDAYTGTSRRVFLTITAYRERPTGGVEYLGSATREFPVNTHNGSQKVPWTVDRLDSPSGARCQPSP